MALNKGYITSDKSEKGDEMYTPYYLAEPIMKFIDKKLKVWCPFDKEWSAYVNLLREQGNEVIATHIDNGYDFFKYEPSDYDIIVSNPPFSKKDEVLKRLYKLDKPFAILLPMNSLQRNSIIEFYSQGLQLLSFDKRASFHCGETMQLQKKPPFASSYFCRNFLPKDLIIEHLEKYDRELVC